MENYEIFKEINNGRAILLTGSGAHIGVKDPMGCEFPSGAALAGRLYKAAGIENPENVYDLQDASESFLECKTSIDMIEEIKRILTVSTVTQTTKKLYSCPWKRVYTTNYVNVPRISTSDLENPLQHTVVFGGLEILHTSMSLVNEPCILRFINPYPSLVVTLSL